MYETKNELNPAKAAQSRGILAQVLSEKQRRNAAYSMRAVARDLGVTHGYLSQVLSGKKMLSFKRAVQFTQFLKMNEVQAHLFLNAVALESMRDRECRAFLEKSMSQQPAAQISEFALLEVDRFRILSEWYHIAILDLTLVKQFKPDAAWVSKELGITTDQVKSAVARLERLGLLEISAGQWTKTTAKLAIPTTYSDRAIRDFHEQMIDKAREVLQSSDPQDFAARDISGITFVVDPARMSEAKKKIEKFKREMLEFMGDGDCTALYQMNVQLFQLNKTKGAVK